MTEEDRFWSISDAELELSQLRQEKAQLEREGRWTGGINRRINMLIPTDELLATRESRITEGLPVGQIDEELSRRKTLLGKVRRQEEREKEIEERWKD